MRFTRKLIGGSFDVPTAQFYAYQKLGKLEDIEEELGADITVVSKALKNGFYGLCSRVEAEYLDEKKRIEWESGNILFLERTGSMRIALKYRRYGLNAYDWVIVLFGYSREKGSIVEVGRFLLREHGKTWALTKEELEQHK